MNKENFEYLSEIEEIIDSIKKMQDRVLDVYNLHPEKSKTILSDLESLKADAGNLHKKFSKLV